MNEDNYINIPIVHEKREHWFEINTGEDNEKLAEITDHTGTCEVTAQDIKNIVEFFREWKNSR